jgi:hypothetical protein
MGNLTILSNGGNKEIRVSLTATCVFTKPNPYNPNGNRKLTFFGTGVKYSTIRIYTLSRELVRTIRETNGEKEITWDGKNEYGEDVVSGIYLYVTESPAEKNACSFTLIRK